MTAVAEPSYKQRLGYHAGLLGGLCFLVSVMLIIGNLQTAKLIAAHLEAEKRATLAQVLPAALYDNEPLQQLRELPPSGEFTAPLLIYTATRQGVFSGAALQTSVYGWGSDIQFIVAINANGEITGARVISHRETPGLADKIEIARDDWITRFTGRSLVNTAESHWAVKKDGGDFDQFTGATITPRAVVNGIHDALLVLVRWRLEQLPQPPSAATPQRQETAS